MKSIDEDIKNQTFQHIYLLYGEEIYLKKQYRNKLKKAMVAEDDNMNCSLFEGKDANPKAIIDLAETLPFFAERRVILVENSGFFKNACEDLANYLADKNQTESTCFVFMEEEVDKRGKMYKAVKVNGKIVEFARQTEDVLLQWIRIRLRKEQKTTTQAVMQLFLSKTGNDMENIDRELEKLLCYTLEKPEIQAADVEAVCIEQSTNKIFDMVNAIAEKNQKRALEYYYDLLALKEPPMRILFLISRQFHILFQVRSCMRAGKGQQEIASICKIPPFAVKKNQAQARSFTIEELEQAVRDGIQAEEDVKTGKMNDQLAVELMIIKYSTKKTSA